MFARIWSPVVEACQRMTQRLRRLYAACGPATLRAPRAHRLADSLPHLAWVVDPPAATLYFNANFRSYTGKSDQRDNAWERIVHPADMATLSAALASEGEPGVCKTCEARLLGADGNYRWFVHRWMPSQNQPGDSPCAFGTSSDIDAQKSSAVRHQKSEQRLRSLVELSSSIVFTLNPAGGFVGPQNSWQRYTGQSAMECDGDGWMLAVHPDDRRRVEQQLVKGTQTCQSLEVDLRLWHTASQAYRHGNVKATRLDHIDAVRSDEVAWIGMISDVHEARERQAYHERLLTVLESSSDFIGLATAEGKVMYVNEAGRTMLGLPQTDALEQHNVLDFFSSQDRSFVHDTALPEAMMHGRWQGRFALRNVQSQKTFPVHYHVFSTLGEDESFLGFGSIARDITDDLRAQKALEAAIAARDDFLSIASHELKTPLTALKLQLQLCGRGLDVAQNKTPTPQRLQRMLDIANRQIDRLTALVEDLLDVSRMQAGKMMYRFDQVDVVAMIEEVLTRLGDAYVEAGIPLSLHIDSPANAYCDRFRIEQVVVNLLTNALKYGQGKPVAVHVGSDGKQAWFSVEDRGMGIDTAHLEKIFKRFERALSHHNISGLGLGLYISKQIVDAHQGQLKVRSQLQAGTTFTVCLSTAPAAVCPSP